MPILVILFSSSILQYGTIMKKKSQPIEPNNDFLGKDISIFLSGAATNSAVCVKSIHGRCDEQTDKAIRVKLDKGFVWIPKKALIEKKIANGTDAYFRLAKWFRFNESQDRIIEANFSISGQSII
jgi:hypothetical protein